MTQISHDLRTPLTAICGYLRLWRKRNPSARDADRYTLILSERAETMKQLTQQLFSYSVSVLDSPSMLRRRVDLRGRWKRILPRWFRCLKSKESRPAVTMPDMPVIRVLDPGALDRILQNLLENAAKYGGSGLAVTPVRKA